MKLDIIGHLSGTKYAKIAEELAKEFKKAGIDTVEKLDNAPLLVRTTYGADIYEVVQILQQPRPAAPKKEALNDQAKN
jgi:hypothetical protein